jgi:NTP pyrophosphatase (non-canonical NTP hydrolase)
MDFKEYQKEAERTSALLETPLMDNLHYLLGMQTEVSELSDIWKKHIAYGKAIDWVNVKEEIGDLAWYVFNFMRVNDLDFEEILETNIKKLRTRYPDKFTQEMAINRDLDKERKILEELDFK